MFDLYYFPLRLDSGNEQAVLPGLIAFPPPKKTGRGRQNDLLLILLTQMGSLPIPPAGFEPELQRMAATYYASAGTVTSAMRTAIEEFNNFLLEYNRRNASSGGQVLAILNVAVQRGDMLFQAHAGPSHSYVIRKDGVEDFSDDFGAGRGLGLSRTTALRFFQSSIGVGEILVVCSTPPATWTTESLKGSVSLTLDALRRRLLNQAGPQLTAGVAQFLEGKGIVHVLRPRLGGTRLPSTPIAAVAAEVVAPPTVAPPTVVSPSPHAPTPEPLVVPPVEAMADVLHTQPMPLITPSVAEPAPEPPSQGVFIGSGRRPLQTSFPTDLPIKDPENQMQGSEEELPPLPNAETLHYAPRRRANVRRPVAGFLLKIQQLSERSGAAWRKFLARLLPGTSDQLPNLSPTTMLIIAIAVPLIVVAVSMAVYLRAGVSEQHLAFLQQAQQYADKARTEKDPVLRRNGWEQVLKAVDKAEQYGQTDSSRSIRQEAQNKLDGIDGIRRWTFTTVDPIGFAEAISIKSMVANDTDIYALDSEQGRVFHMTKGRSYEEYIVDPDFKCGPGPTVQSGATQYIRKLINMALVDVPAIAPNKASIIAVDEVGTVVYCAAGSEPMVTRLPQETDVLGTLVTMKMVQGTMYLLDRTNNKLLIYDGEDLLFDKPPHLYFYGNKPTPNMSDVIDMALVEDELFLLSSTGQITKCQYSSFEATPTRCDDPIKFTGGASDPLHAPASVSTAKWVELISVPAPESMLYILDAASPAIYRFTFALDYQDQIRPVPGDDLATSGKAPTALTTLPNGDLLVAAGNRIYLARVQ